MKSFDKLVQIATAHFSSVIITTELQISLTAYRTQSTGAPHGSVQVNLLFSCVTNTVTKNCKAAKMYVNMVIVSGAGYSFKIGACQGYRYSQVGTVSFDFVTTVPCQFIHKHFREDTHMFNDIHVSTNVVGECSTDPRNTW